MIENQVTVTVSIDSAYVTRAEFDALRAEIEKADADLARRVASALRDAKKRRL